MKKTSTFFSMLIAGFQLLNGQVANEPGSGNALDFNTSPDRIEVADSPSLNPSNALSVETWINTTQTDGNIGIVGKWTSASDGNANRQYTLNLSIGKIEFHVFAGGNQYSLVSPLTYNDGKWHHLSGTFDGSTQKLYIDGRLVTSQIATGTIPSYNQILKIGTYAGEDGFNNHFDGDIDEVRIWNRAFTQTEIRQNMCKKLTGNETNLVGYWRMDEGSGTTAFDSSPNGNDGTLN